jgi:transporter family-2 protein
MDKIFWIALAFVAGSLLPIQGAFNTKLGAAGGSALHASLISFGVGTLALATYTLVSRQTVSWSGLATAPWYAWVGGFCGAICLTVIILVFPRLGPGVAFGLLVAGQLFASLLLEHFNILVAQPHPISFPRLVGVALVLGGVVCIRAF